MNHLPATSQRRAVREGQVGGRVFTVFESVARQPLYRLIEAKRVRRNTSRETREQLLVFTVIWNVTELRKKKVLSSFPNHVGILIWKLIVLLIYFLHHARLYNSLNDITNIYKRKWCDLAQPWERTAVMVAVVHCSPPNLWKKEHWGVGRGGMDTLPDTGGPALNRGPWIGNIAWKIWQGGGKVTFCQEGQNF